MTHAALGVHLTVTVIPLHIKKPHYTNEYQILFCSEELHPDLLAAVLPQMAFPCVLVSRCLVHCQRYVRDNGDFPQKSLRRIELALEVFEVGFLIDAEKKSSWILESLHPHKKRVPRKKSASPPPINPGGYSLVNSPYRKLAIDSFSLCLLNYLICFLQHTSKQNPVILIR